MGIYKNRVLPSKNQKAHRRPSRGTGSLQRDGDRIAREAVRGHVEGEPIYLEATNIKRRR